MSNSITSQTPLPHPIPATDELGPLVGQNFGGYEITSYIGEGPTGAVYRAEDLVGSRMAVKVMHQELSRKKAADQLWSDLQKLSKLRSPHLVGVYDGGFGDEGQFFYVMDELVGCDLEAGLEESGALTPKKALEIIRQICVAVETAHTNGVVHGGLKPRNVFLCPHDTELVVKVLDFGATRLAGGVDKGVIVGNPFYMAPEQFGGTAEPRTDVYAIGVMMYELFSGTLPFAGPSHGQVMMRHLAETPPPPPGVEAELSRIILRALAKTPAGRFQTVKQLREAVDRWAKAQPKLEDIVANQVVARAAEARAMKQAALSTPDATAQMPKMDMLDLARATTRQETAAPTKKSAGAATTENPNSSESVEASLEDFISQANASFPTSDGWDLHTGDVELIDEGQEGLDVEDASSPKPLIVKPRKVDPAPVVAKAAQPAPSRPRRPPRRRCRWWPRPSRRRAPRRRRCRWWSRRITPVPSVAWSRCRRARRRRSRKRAASPARAPSRRPERTDLVSRTDPARVADSLDRQPAGDHRRPSGRVRDRRVRGVLHHQEHRSGAAAADHRADAGAAGGVSAAAAGAAGGDSAAADAARGGSSAQPVVVAAGAAGAARRAAGGAAGGRARRRAGARRSSQAQEGRRRAGSAQEGGSRGEGREGGEARACQEGSTGEEGSKGRRRLG